MTGSPLHSVTIEQAPIDLLRLDPANPRRIDENELNALERSLRQSAERTGRVCAGIELDPRYCDVTIARWEAFTGSVAERVDG